jgi:hypothetical protein
MPLKPAHREALLRALQARFDKHMQRHAGIAWPAVLARLEKNAAALQSLQAMEQSGGEPDVVGQDSASGALVFVDCAAESPSGRRSCCYDEEALLSRKENRPAHSAMAMAAAWGIELLDEAQYRALQQLGDFDTKTSSWIKTPEAVRQLGGALFCDRRYGQVFTYHNGVPSYYSTRGFRGRLVV